MAKRAKPRPGRANRRTRVTERPAVRSSGPPVVLWPATSPPPPVGPAPEAVSQFEKGLKDLERHAYAEAVTTFRAILGGYPGERALLDRVRLYLELCERELRRKPPSPKTVEERLTAATAALNDGNEARAGELARSVLKDNADHDLAHYLLAAVAARRGASDEALSHLARSIALSPEAGAQARFDSDFESLRDTDAFRRLTEPPAPPSPSGNRRPRRGRG